ncbi:glycosyltransferase family 2 protein [Paenibacillus sp. FSL P4-0338]|uniref:glycosyltransferase family 2 protein n=1 Tax=Paenibacillus sp. FSL P4-0338 TaxID=2921635 RepID=UPI0030F72B8E
MNPNRIRVLLGSPIHQKPAILEQFLNSLLRLNLKDIDLDFYLIDDNPDEAASGLLQQFARNGRSVFLQSSGYHDDYIRDEHTHVWHSNLIWKVAGFKNLMIRRAEAFGYDYLFLIDSDLILHPDTLVHLIGTGKDIISEIFWTQWQPNTLLQPQVWMHDEYNQWEIHPGEQLSPEEIQRRFFAFLQKMQQPGIYEVGGLGACTLISGSALSSGISYDPVRNISYWGEDRHFCIRAAALGFPLFVDTHFPALHLYRDSDLDLVAEFIRHTSGTEAEPEASHEAPIFEDSDTTADDDLPDCAETAQPPADKRVQEAAAQWEVLWTEAEARQHLSKEPLPSDAGGDVTGAEKKNPAVPASRRPKLTLTMIVKNEGTRFLRQVLEEHRKYIDEAVIIDDASTDDTADICREALEGIPLHLIQNPVSRFHNESELRKQQWEAVVRTRPEWILNLDGDELFESCFPEEIDSLLRTADCDLFCFRLYDFWDEASYREDSYWQAHQSYRPFLLRYREDFNYAWNDLPQHCGRLPENIFELSHQLSNLRLKHLGWSKPEFRLEKYLRYMLLDPDAQYGWKEQYQSILDPHPRLVPWSE